MAAFVKSFFLMKLLGHICTKLHRAEFHHVLPGPQRGPQVASSVWGAPVAGGRRGDGPEHRTTSAGRLVNSGTRENIESANEQNGGK